MAYINLRKKYMEHLKQINQELENPSSNDVHTMDSLSLKKIDEIVLGYFFIFLLDV